MSIEKLHILVCFSREPNKNCGKKAKMKSCAANRGQFQIMQQKSCKITVFLQIQGKGAAGKGNKKKLLTYIKLCCMIQKTNVVIKMS